MNVFWTETARANLREIKQHIAQRSPRYALRMVEKILARGDSLSSQPQLGPMVLEYEDPSLRELFEHPYRIIYRVEDQYVAIVTVIHSARRLPRKL